MHVKLAVIGTGYVGLVSGACFSEFGFDVTCIDKDAGKIDRIKSGVMPMPCLLPWEHPPGAGMDMPI